MRVDDRHRMTLRLPQDLFARVAAVAPGGKINHILTEAVEAHVEKLEARKNARAAAAS